jgi:hypothetical protein
LLADIPAKRDSRLSCLMVLGVMLMVMICDLSGCFLMLYISHRIAKVTEL